MSGKQALLDGRRAIEERDRFKGMAMALHLALKALVESIDEAEWVPPDPDHEGSPQMKAVPWSTSIRLGLDEVINETEAAVMRLVVEVKDDLMREVMPKAQTMFMLAEWLDKHGDGESTEIQDDLRRWAQELNDPEGVAPA